jgi:putative ABC transport system permease protein
MAPSGRIKAALFGRASTRQQVDAELDFHIEMLAQDLVRDGMTPDAALAAARARFGDLDQLRADCATAATQRDRTLRRSSFFADFRQDVRQALRQLRLSPTFTGASVLTLALGIGATTTIFGAVDSVVLEPFAWADPSRVVDVSERWHDMDGNVSVGNFVDWRDQAHTFTAMAAEQFSPVNVSEGSTSERVGGGRVTGDFFRVFGVRPALGRVLGPEDAREGQAGTAVLSYGLWLRRFGGDRRVLNRVVRFNDMPVTVVGVMPRGFDPSSSGEEIWLPRSFNPSERAQHDEHFLLVVGLLAPGVTIAHAQADLDPVAHDLRQRFPQDDAERGVRVRLLSDMIIGDQRGRLLTVLGAVSFVLLIACGNVANLLLARGNARSHELAIRTALGARRGRLVRQLLTESVVLALCSAIVGLGLAWLGIKLVIGSAPEGAFPRLDEAGIDGRVLLFTLGAALVSAILSGLAPALRAARSDVQTTLRAGGRGAGNARDRLRGALIVAEVALALALLDGAGLLVRSAMHLDRTPLGFDPSGVLAARLSLPAAGYPEPGRVGQTFLTIANVLRQVPGVTSAAIVSQAPVSSGSTDNGLIPEGRPRDVRYAIQSRMRLASSGYLNVMRIPLIEGRDFTDQDVSGAPRVMIVSRAFAEQAWPGGDAIGKRILCCEGSPTDPMWKTVIGVAGDVRSDGPQSVASPEFYLPIAQAPVAAWTWVQRTMTLVARTTSGDAAALTPALRAAVQSVDPSVPLFAITTMHQAVRKSTAEHRFNTLLLLTLALVGLALSGAGIASVVAFFVTARTREIGVRMAMGATGSGIIALLVRQNMRPLGIGLLLGLAGAAAATRLLRGSLYGVQAVDPVTAIAVILAVALVALVAIVIPARRATRVDPVVVLQG